MDSVQLLFRLIRVAMCGEPPTQELTNACTPETLAQVFALASRHDLAHLVGQGASKLQLPDSEPLQNCKKAAMQALLRHTRQVYAFQNLCNILEQASVPFIPLKGSVLRDFYPESWMRTSCDMDVLVHMEDLPRAQQALEAQGWKYWTKSFHDVSYFSPEGVHLELHHTTIEDHISTTASQIMEGIWQDATPLPDKRFHMCISDALFYYYHMVHMAKHVVDGGCGIRTFLDIWVLNHRMEFDPAARQALLSKGDLTAFATATQTLAEIWFSGAPMDENSRILQEFILSGGTYGSMVNRVSLQQKKKGGKFKFALQRIFQPFNILKLQFPVLEKHKWLTPVFHVVRWSRLLFGGVFKRSVRELQTTAAVSDDDQATAQALIRHLGL